MTKIEGVAWAMTLCGGIVAVAAVTLLFNMGMDNNEVVECESWKSQAAEFDQFFMTRWQDQQCRSHGIIINAPVK